MPHTLRSFLETIDNKVVHIHDPVDPVKQVGILSSEARGPYMLHNMPGFPGWRLTDILVKDRQGQAAALGVASINEVCPTLASRMAKGYRRAKMVKDAPVKEVMHIGKDANIHSIPIPIHSHGDAGRYLGSGLTITKDPDTKVRNYSIIRTMLTEDPRKCAFWMAARHSWGHYLKYAAKNEKMPMAYAIGMHPLYEILANWSGPHQDFDEMEYAAAVLGEDVEMVKCETIDLEAPAHAEVVIEGFVHPSDRIQEGPFGEFTGYGSGAEGPAPVFEVTAITHRKDPIFRHIQATWITDHQPLTALPMEAAYFNRLKETHGNTKIIDVYSPPSATLFTLIVQMEARWDGTARDVLLSALSGPNLQIKIAIAVDEDVDIYNADEVLWAISTRVDPAKDIIVIPHERCHPLDISIPQMGRDYTVMRIGGKLGIDATKPPLWREQERSRFTRVDPMGRHDPTLAKLIQMVRRG